MYNSDAFGKFEEKTSSILLWKNPVDIC